MLARLHVVTDSGVLRSDGFTERAQRLLAAHGPGLALHLRGHDLDGGALYALAEALAFAGDAAGSELLVNDRVDVALAAGADGVQLGRRSLPVASARELLGIDAWIGYSAHGAGEAAEAVGRGADFVLLGTIYPSASHPGGRAAGPELVRAAAGAVEAPVVAIGGVTPERVPELVASGAYGVAVLGGVWRTGDPAAAAGRFLAALDEALEGRNGWGPPGKSSRYT